MRLNNQPIQDHVFNKAGRRRKNKSALDKERETQKDALRHVHPLVLNGREQDCVSPRCLQDGSIASGGEMSV